MVARRLAERPLRVAGDTDHPPEGVVVAAPPDEAADRVALLPVAPSHR